MRGEQKPDNAMDTAREGGNEEALKGEGRFYCRSQNEDDSQGVQEASYDNSVDCCYAMPVYNPVLQLLRGGVGVGGSPTSR